MNLLSRVKLFAKNRIIVSHAAAVLEQSNFYSTKTADSSKKTVKSTKARTQKSSDSPSLFSQGIREQIEDSNVWPKPREIPYEPKDSNFVNLVGYVKTPVQFEVSADGKHSAAIVISQNNSGEEDSLSVAVFFEGDLAHVVSCHVKENDCIFVSGQLSGEPLQFSVGENIRNLHIVAENLNFVEGFVKKTGISFSNVEVENLGSGRIEEMIENVVNDKGFNQQLEETLVHGKSKPFSAIKDDWAAGGSIESKPGQSDGNNVERGDKEKDGVNSWRDLVNDPINWWDYRDHKANGLVKDKFPDFKRKGSGESLWINSAPKWALDVLGKLAFDVKVINGKLAKGGEGNSERDDKVIINGKQALGGKGNGERRNVGKGGEDSWRDLVENPSGWWDNRLEKRNPRAPDFKHKERGEGLWLDKTPDWALSRLPPLKNGQNSVDG